MSKLNKKPKFESTHVLRKTAFKTSIALAVGYIMIAWMYIMFSSKIDGSIIQWKQSLGEYALAKDFLFTSVTGGIVFIWTYYLLRLCEDRLGEISHYQEVLGQAGQQATAGVLAASIAHDSTNILSSIRICLELIERDALELSKLDSSQALLATMKKAVKELAALNRRVLDISNPQDTIYLQKRDLVNEVRTTLSLARVNSRLKDCNLTFEADESLVCKIHSTWVNEMVLNLVLNAGDATSNTGEILVKVYRSGNFALIEVHDNGCGIEPAVRERIFDPFFTTKHEGNGLGLVAVKSCVEKHNGFLQISTSHLGGALFSIWLPATIEKTSLNKPKTQIWSGMSSLSCKNQKSLVIVGS